MNRVGSLWSRQEKRKKTTPSHTVKLEGKIIFGLVMIEDDDAWFYSVELEEMEEICLD